MAINDGTLVVELRIKDTSGDSSNDDDGTPQQEDLKPKRPNKDKEREKRIKKLKQAGNYALNQVMYDVRANVSLTTSRYFNMSENYLLEQDINNFMGMAGKINSGVSTVFLAGKIGHAIAPGIGTAIGIGVGAATWGVGQYIGYQSKLNSYYTSLNAVNYGIAFSKERAGGLYDGGRGTEN